MSVEVIKTFTTTCNGVLHDAISTDVAFTAVLEQIVAAGSGTTSFFFDVALSGPESTALDNILASWSCPVVTQITGVFSDALTVKDEGINVPNTPHYSLDFVGSGVSVADATNGVSTITIQPTPKLFYGHNGSIVQTLTSSVINVNIATNIRNDAIYSIVSNEVTINESGWYKIIYGVGAEATGSSRSGMECGLRLNGTLVPGSMSWAYHRTSNPGEDTATAEILLQITSGDSVNVGMKERVGSVRTMVDGCRLLIEQIETI